MKEPKVWLVLDVSYLAWRSFHTTGGMKHGSNPTGVLFGFFRELRTLTEQHATDNFVFCFDSINSKRRELYPEYKGDRAAKEQTEEERIAIAGMRKQVGRLKSKALPEIGFRNIFCQDGYEADDMIASVCHNVNPRDEVIIVSADRDLYQLLREPDPNDRQVPRVVLWNPFKKETKTRTGLLHEEEADPFDWPAIKAIVGKKDNLKGVKGVGEKGAVDFFKRSRKAFVGSVSKKDKVIFEFMKTKRYKTNLMIATLPFPGIAHCVPKKDKPIELSNWNRVMKEYGIKSLFGSVPGYTGFKLRRR